ncbi:2-oxoglutarate dehydrogenase E1 component [Streptomyces sp. 1222.5]|nr:2-oxoglutarate dehydrogenase-like enzyme [Streptomyces sp. 5112.2]SED44324.1 2-oxoglutarate dehydrogenase E1 component [Streptomyces sp. 1222.5]
MVFTPKSMLRSKAATSALTEFTQGGFRPILPDGTQDPGRVTRVLLCAGKVFYHLDAHRGASDPADTAIVRVERLYPFPEDELAAELAPPGDGGRAVGPGRAGQPARVVLPRAAPAPAGQTPCGPCQPTRGARTGGRLRSPARSKQQALVRAAFR